MNNIVEKSVRWGINYYCIVKKKIKFAVCVCVCGVFGGMSFSYFSEAGLLRYLCMSVRNVFQLQSHSPAAFDANVQPAI